MDWSDKAQIRFGAEYALSDALALRAGYYYDPSPAPDTTMNILLPSYTYNVLTAGVGYKVAGLQLDFGIEYLMGKDRDVHYLKTLTDPALRHGHGGRVPHEHPRPEPLHRLQVLTGSRSAPVARAGG